jgi:hypothetical protein
MELEILQPIRNWQVKGNDTHLDKWVTLKPKNSASANVLPPMSMVL